MKKEEVFKFYNTYKIYIFPTIVTLSSLILIVFVVYPQISKLITNQKLEGELINRSKFLEVKAEALEGLDSTDLSRKVQYALNAYPTDKDFPYAIGLLQNMIAQSGFNINSLSLGTGSSKKTGSESYSVRIELSGSIALLPTLFNNIENSNRLMSINNIEYTLSKDGQSVDLALNIAVLFAAAPQEFGSIDSPLPELSKKDEDVIAKLARSGNVTIGFQATAPLGPRGRENPFE